MLAGRAAVLLEVVAAAEVVAESLCRERAAE